MFFSPLSEIAWIGRNPPYLYSFAIFFIVSLLAATIGDRSFGGLMTMRALQGLFGSPILASGAASIHDIYGLSQAPYAYMTWIAAMYCGPAVSVSAHSEPHQT